MQTYSCFWNSTVLNSIVLRYAYKIAKKQMHVMHFLHNLTPFIVLFVSFLLTKMFVFVIDINIGGR